MSFKDSNGERRKETICFLFFYFGKIYERKKKEARHFFFLLFLLASFSSPPFYFSTRMIALRVCVRSTIFFSFFQSPCVPHHSFHPMERKKCVQHAYTSSTHLSNINENLAPMTKLPTSFYVLEEMIRDARKWSFRNIIITNDSNIHWDVDAQRLELLILSDVFWSHEILSMSCASQGEISLWRQDKFDKIKRVMN